MQSGALYPSLGPATRHARSGPHGFGPGRPHRAINGRHQRAFSKGIERGMPRGLIPGRPPLPARQISGYLSSLAQPDACLRPVSATGMCGRSGAGDPNGVPASPLPPPTPGGGGNGPPPGRGRARLPPSRIVHSPAGDGEAPAEPYRAQARSGGARPCVRRPLNRARTRPILRSMRRYPWVDAASGHASLTASQSPRTRTPARTPTRTRSRSCVRVRVGVPLR